MTVSSAVMNRFSYVATFTLLFNVCTSPNSASLPYDAWRLGFLTPSYMDVWIETADVVDVRGDIYIRAMSGTAETLRPPNNTGNPSGWPRKPGLGKGKYVKRADLPKKILLRWQSLLEPQTYNVSIDIPESTRDIMRKKEEVFCAFNGKSIIDYRKTLVVGLAPGGFVKVWVMGPCLPAIEVAQVKAEVDTRGPYEGQSGGKYDPASNDSKAFVEKFGIPYESWK